MSVGERDGETRGCYPLSGGRDCSLAADAAERQLELSTANPEVLLRRSGLLDVDGKGDCYGMSSTASGSRLRRAWTQRCDD